MDIFEQKFSKYGKINMFTAGAAVLGCSAEGSDCRNNLMVMAFSIAFKHSCGFMLSTYRENYSQYRTLSLKVFAYSNIIKVTLCCYFVEEIKWNI